MYGSFNAVGLICHKFRYVYSILLMVTCVYNFVTAAKVLCQMEQWCVIFSSAMVGIYTKVLALTTFLSRVVIVVQSEHDVLKFRATIEAYEIYSPKSTQEHKKYNMFSLTIVFAYLIVVLPAIIGRLYYTYHYESHTDCSLFVYYSFMYVQNLSMCYIEMQFISWCFLVFSKFREINDDLRKLKDENVNSGKYPFIANVSVCVDHNERPFQCVIYDKDFYRPRFKGHPIANVVEILRVKHWLLRQAVDILNSLFGVQMGLSIFLLWTMALFDIYYKIFNYSPLKILFYGWLSQYILRMFLINLVAHYTIKQAMISKVLIADISNQLLDDNTKEELLLFVNQVGNHPIEFTAWDFFTLNIQVLKSAIAAGATYLVVLLQLHSDKNVIDLQLNWISKKYAGLNKY